jgi:hypothetical protein
MTLPKLQDTLQKQYFTPQPDPNKPKIKAPDPKTSPLSKLPTSFVPKTGGIYFSPNATLTINVWNTVTSQALTFQCWYLDPDGNLKQVPATGAGALLDMTGLSSARAANVQSVNLPNTGGTIVSFSARVKTGGITARAQTLVKAEIDNNGAGTSSFSNTQVIVYGYVYTRKDLTYPAPDSIQDPVSGIGFTNTITTSVLQDNGGAILITVPTNARWAMKLIYVPKQTTASAGTRNTYLGLLSAASVVFWNSPIDPGQPASKTYAMYYLINYSSPVDSVYGTSNTTASAFIPDFKMVAGAAFKIFFLGQLVGDLTQAVYTFEEWLDPGS